MGVTLLCILISLVVALGYYLVLIKLVIHWQMMAKASVRETKAVMDWILINAQSNLFNVGKHIDLINKLLFILAVSVIIGLLFLYIRGRREGYLWGLLVGSTMRLVLRHLAPTVPIIQGVRTRNVIRLLTYIKFSFYAFEGLIFVLVVLTLVIIYVIWRIWRRKR